MANIQQIIEVDGVVLTPSSVCLLKSLQGDDNSMIINLRDSLGDIISYFGSEIHVGNEQCETDAEFKRFISELSFLRQYLKDLKKP